MKYRNFGNSDFKPSAIGFGAMRFPSKPEDNYDNPIESKSIELVRYAIDKGINYIDTAYPYNGEKSEIILGKALKEGYRDKIKIATKMPCWLIEKFDDFDKYLNIQLERLQTERIDFYLLHGVWKSRWEKMKKLEVFKWANKAVESGEIGSFGFSFHDDLNLFKEVIDEYDDWGMCQIQYNFLNENVQAGTEGLKYAAKKGIPIVVMEPLLGGCIANPPKHINKIWSEEDKNPADIALRWIWDKPEVSLILSGMRSIEEIDRNIKSAENSGFNELHESEKRLVKKVTKEYEKLSTIPCTKCRYCMPCPHGVDIPKNFEVYNESLINIHLNKAIYSFHIKESESARACIHCKECEKKCPQNIKISKLMSKVDKKLRIEN